MDWSAFGGGVAGVISSFLVIVVAIVVYDWWERRKPPAPDVPPLPSSKPSLEDVLEIHLEQHILKHFASLFPKWHIYASSKTDSQDTTTVLSDNKPIGVRYDTKEAGVIDFLCHDSDGNFLVIELKRNRAADKVASQIERYITWVERNLLQPGKQVQGLIIARAPDRYLPYTLARRQNVQLQIYRWQLQLESYTLPPVAPPNI